MPKRLSFSYYPWISQTTKEPALKRVIEEFVGLLNKALSGDFQIDPPVSFNVPQQLKEIEAPPSGDLVGKIGLLNPLGYAFSHEAVPDVKAVAVVLRPKIDGAGEAVPFYRAQLYTNYATGIESLDDVRGRSMAYGSSQSTSNFLKPAIHLLSKRIHPLGAFARIEFTGGHDKAARAVYEGRLDVGAGHDGVIADLARQPGFENAASVLRRLDWSPDIPSDPIAIHTADSGIRSAVTQALLKIAPEGDSKADGNLLVKDFWGTDLGFRATDEAAYEDLLKDVSELRLTRLDMIGKA